MYFCFIDYAKTFDCVNHNKLWKILKEMGISDHLTCLLRNLYAKSLQMVTAAMKLKDTPWKESYDQPRQHIKKQRHYFVNKGPSSQGYGFSSGRVWM